MVDGDEAAAVDEVVVAPAVVGALDAARVPPPPEQAVRRVRTQSRESRYRIRTWCPRSVPAANAGQPDWAISVG